MGSETKRGKPKKRKWRWLRYRKGDHGHNLLVAAQRWIHANGGTAVMLGGIGMMDGARAYNYYLAIHVTGHRPEMRKKEHS